MARLPGHMTRVDTRCGVRYEVRVRVRRGDGSRFQHKKRFESVDAAKAWHSQIASELAEGAHTAPSELTVRQACEGWLTAKTVRVKPTTAAAYQAALKPVIDRYGDVKVQRITKHDAEVLITELRTGTPGRPPWARTSINPMLARWRSVWAGLHPQGVLARNVVALVEPLRKPSGEPAMKIDDVLTDAEVEQLLAAHAKGAGRARRREPFLHLALLGLRRGEIAGLRWSAIELDAKVPMLTIRATRVSISAGVIEQESAKTASSARTLPIPTHIIPILRRPRAEQVERASRAGHLCEGNDDDGHVIALDLGGAISPRTLDRWWTRSLEHAGFASPPAAREPPHRGVTAGRAGCAGPTHRSLAGSRRRRRPGHAHYVRTHNSALVGAAALLSG